MKRNHYLVVSLSLLGLLAVQAQAAFLMNDVEVGLPVDAVFTATGTVGADMNKTNELLSNSAFFDGVAHWMAGDAPVAAVQWGGNIGTWTADLKQAYTIDRIVITCSRTNQWYGKLGVSVSHSEDGLNWTSAGSTSNVPYWSFTTTANDEFDFGQASVRYIKVSYNSPSSTTSSHVKVDAMNIYAVPEPATMSLLGFGGIATCLRRRRGK